MKLSKGISLVLSAAALVAMLAGCAGGGSQSAVSEQPSAEEQSSVQEFVFDKDDFKVEFKNGYELISDYFEMSDGWTNGSMFICTWRKGNASFGADSMTLTIDNDEAGTKKIPYSAAEFRSKDFYGYGSYEVTMKPIKNDGVVSSFFTYTGPSDSNPWDEIDIEFLGKDTTKVQFNYFTNGKGEHEYLFDLGFDAAEEYHTYGFKWEKDKITWYVDGKAVHEATEDIPVTAGKIMMNVWPGKGVNSWLKKFDGTVPLSAEYKEFSFKAEV